MTENLHDVVIVVFFKGRIIKGGKEYFVVANHQINRIRQFI